MSARAGSRSQKATGERRRVALSAAGPQGPRLVRTRIGAALERGANRALLVAVAPLAGATLLGLLLLWPREGSPERSSALGDQLPLETADVVRITPLPCGDGTGAVAPGSCATAEILLTSGPDEGSTTTLDLFEGPGQPQLEEDDGIVVGRSVDPAVGNVYFFSDFQR